MQSVAAQPLAAHTHSNTRCSKSTAANRPTKLSGCSTSSSGRSDISPGGGPMASGGHITHWLRPRLTHTCSNIHRVLLFIKLHVQDLWIASAKTNVPGQRCILLQLSSQCIEECIAKYTGFFFWHQGRFAWWSVPHKLSCWYM